MGIFPVKNAPGRLIKLDYGKRKFVKTQEGPNGGVMDNISQLLLEKMGIGE